jgi:hypothetical protein
MPSAYHYEGLGMVEAAHTRLLMHRLTASIDQFEVPLPGGSHFPETENTDLGMKQHLSACGDEVTRQAW